jgi:hypothetical protein
MINSSEIHYAIAFHYNLVKVLMLEVAALTDDQSRPLNYYRMDCAKWKG